MHTNLWKLDFSSCGGSGMCRRDGGPLLLCEMIKTTSRGVNQRAFLDPAHYTSLGGSPQSGRDCFCLARRCCSEHARGVPVVALQCVRTHVGGACPRLLITRTKATRGNLRVLNKEFFPHILSRSGCQRSEGRAPLSANELRLPK